MRKELELYKELIQERPELFKECSQGTYPIETNFSKLEAYTEKPIGVVYKSGYNMMVVDLIKNNNGSYFTYERVIPTVKDGAVVVLPITEDGKVVLLENFKHSNRQYMYEIPRSYGSENFTEKETVIHTVQTKLHGKVTSLEKLGTVYADSGLTGGSVGVYACRVSNIKEKNAIILNIDDVKNTIKVGNIKDNFTIAALSLFNLAHI